jgi:short subunit dehydrogenase-like uncharacterized protein
MTSTKTYPALPGPLLVYGAYGKTGSMVAKTAIKRGHEVVLAGTDRHRLDLLSAEIGARGAQVRLDAPLELRQLVRKAACVIHVAGPFAETFRPMLEACSTEGVPYTDLNGELDVFRAIESFVATHQPQIPIVTGTGFGVAAGESAAMHAAAMLAKPERIWLGLAPDLGQRSPGALRSTLQTVAQGGYVLANGQFVSERVGRRSFQTGAGQQRRTFISMPLGELWAIGRSTGVANVIGGAAVPKAERILLRSGALGLLGRSQWIRNQLVKLLAQEASPGAPTFESLVWARAEDNQGHTAEVVMTMGEGYQWSAEAAVRAAEHVALDRRPGLWTPGQYFGKQFALEVTGTKLMEADGRQSG